MIIDTSAIIAMLTDEPEAASFEGAVDADAVRLMSPVTLVESSVVIEGRLGEAGGRELDLWLYRAGVDVVPLDRDQAELARLAYRMYGKGRHPAGLNFGDCFAYALAAASGEPLLFKGDDLARTDVRGVETR